MISNDIPYGMKNRNMNRIREDETREYANIYRHGLQALYNLCGKESHRPVYRAGTENKI
jgi:hypothetical protein